MLKRTIIFSVLGAFIFQALVFNLFLYTLTLVVKYEEKTGSIELIEFSEKQYSQLKINDTEFTYNNNLYDVLSSQRESGIIKLLCKVDAKEKDLLEKLIESFKQSKTKKLISFSLVAELDTSNEFISFINTNNKAKYTYFKSSVIENNIERTIPPPKV